MTFHHDPDNRSSGFSRTPEARGARSLGAKTVTCAQLQDAPTHILVVEDNTEYAYPSMTVEGWCSVRSETWNSQQAEESSCTSVMAIGAAPESLQPSSASDMLCFGEEASHSAAPLHKPLFGYEEPGTSHVELFNFDVERDDKILRAFYRDRRNIIDDSIVPEKVPHIVITPADDTWEDQYNAWHNRVDFQVVANLTVPQINLTEDSGFPPPWVVRAPASVQQPQPMQSRRLKFIERCIPPITGNSGNTGMIPLQKQKCKDAIFAACTHAQAFRERYDQSSDMFSILETPFFWIDPAEPILTNRWQFRSTVIHSVSPFRVPHIIINQPPPQFQSPEENMTPNPQNQQYGQCLTVPSPFVEIINEQNRSPALLYDYPLEDYLSRPETPLPETPIEGDEDDIGPDILFGHYTSIAICEDFDVKKRHDARDDLTSRKVIGTSVKSRPIFYIEEDEDDLPPFDDWYTR